MDVASGSANTSTTVVVMKLRVVCHANMWRCLGANGATSTRLACALRVAGWPAQGASRGLAAPPHAGLPQTSRRLAGCQAARGMLAQRFFGASSVGRWTARSTVNSAAAPRAKVLGRYQPGHRRPSSCSRPPSPVASAKHRATVQRLPATGTTVATVVAWGAHTPEAGRAVGALRLRRTNSQRRPAGCHGAARGSPAQSDPRGPGAPAPARTRSPPAGARVARLVVTCGGRPARQTSACPETANPWGRACSSRHTRRQRASP
jgi:hypothetical protein